MTLSRPLVGLSVYRERARWSVWDVSADLLPTAYSRSIENAGGTPVLLPPVEGAHGRPDVGAAAGLVGRMDALVICGGADVDPGRYDEEPHARTAGWRPDRDAWEIALLDAATTLDLPVLGICRGMQVMAVQAGGSLEQHLPDVVGHEQHSPDGDSYGDIEVETVRGSRLSALIGDRVTVGCHHHQSVRKHPGYEPAAYAADGTLEGMEHPRRRFCLAVQWHPETRDDLGLFRGIVDASDGSPRAPANGA